MGASSWSDDDIALLTELWAKNLSARQIARYFQDRFSRSAICGRVHRLKLPDRPTGLNRGRVRGKPNLSLVPKAKPAPTPLAVLVEPAPQGPLGDFPDTRCCRWPTGEGDSFQCCAAPGWPYCDAHKAKAWIKPTGRTR